MRSELARLRSEVGALVAKHDRAKDISEFSRFADDPGGFFRDVLRCPTMWSRQIEMAEMMRDCPRSVVVTSNGIGKDHLTARAALWWIFARRGFVILTGPTERQVKQILMREVRRAFVGARDLPGELYALELRVDDDGEAGLLAFTSDNPDKLTGFHHPRLLICVTEAQGVSDEAIEAAQACVTGPENRLFCYGNPTRPSGAFYRIAHSPNWEPLTVPSTEHPNVVSGLEQIPGAVSREWCENMRQEYGEASSIYRSRVLALFPSEALEGLVKREWLRAAVARWNARDLLSFAHPHTLALDVARYGPDASVLAHVQGPHVNNLVTWRGASTTESAARVMSFGQSIAALTRENRHCRGYAGQRPTVHVDEPGLGGGAIDALRAGGYPTRAFNGANSPTDPRRFLNLRAQAFWAFRTLLEKGKIALPPDPALEEEALAIEWQINQSGLIQIAGKDLLRKALGRSPDRLDAVVIGLGASVGGISGRATVQKLYM